VVDAGALTKALSSVMNFPLDDPSLLFTLALKSEDCCQMILNDGLACLIMHLDSTAFYRLSNLVQKASTSQLTVAFSAVASAMKTGTTNMNSFKFVLMLFKRLTGAAEPDFVLRQRRTFWQSLSKEISLPVIQSLVDAGIIEAILQSVVSVNDDRRTYKISCDILLVFCCNAQNLIITMPLLEAFASFQPRGPRRDCSLNVLFHCVTSLIDNDSHLPLIERSGLIRAIFSHEISDALLMQVLRMTDRNLESGRSQVFRHLVSCDLISVLVSAFKYQSKLTVSCDAIVSCLVRIMKAGDEYKRLVDEMELPQLLVPLLETEFRRTRRKKMRGGSSDN
jgi:hypothetical protein